MLKISGECEEPLAAKHAFAPALGLENISRPLFVQIEPVWNTRRIVYESDPRFLVGCQPIESFARVAAPSKFLLDETVQEHTFPAMQAVEAVHGVSPTTAVVSRPPMPSALNFFRGRHVEPGH